MTSHILNRPAPPVAPKPVSQKPTAAEAKAAATEAVGRAISKRRF